jgi:hypothetical protein
MEETLDARQQALQAGHPVVKGWRRPLRRPTVATVLGAPTAWLVATAACVALALVALARPATPVRPDAEPLLPARAPASQVERAFSGMTPFSVQRNMGASGGKDATCSIFSDGDLDSGARVTWAVTLCTVHAIGSGTSG